jgi:isoquinoline 1-oxidoreductase alpha subunit
MRMRFVVNGAGQEVDVDPATPLLWVLRDHLGMTGTKYGCGIGQCGACTVHAGGSAVRSCQIPAEAASQLPITTIEGLAAQGPAVVKDSKQDSRAGTHPLQQAWVELNVPQCGYCQAGMLMAAAALLQRQPNPTDADIDEAITNICRCGTYPRIRAAIHRAAASLPQRSARQ